ncbi:hypothetical protein Tco_0443972, partial [Tanacetum coccineum]
VLFRHRPVSRHQTTGQRWSTAAVNGGQPRWTTAQCRPSMTVNGGESRSSSGLGPPRGMPRGTTCQPRVPTWHADVDKKG